MSLALRIFHSSKPFGASNEIGGILPMTKEDQRFWDILASRRKAAEEAAKTKE